MSPITRIRQFLSRWADSDTAVLLFLVIAMSFVSNLENKALTSGIQTTLPKNFEHLPHNKAFPISPLSHDWLAVDMQGDTFVLHKFVGGAPDLTVTVPDDTVRLLHKMK